MIKYVSFALIFVFLFGAMACNSKTKPEDASVWKKVKLDFNRLDENGLAGPTNGKVAVNYEFCIPAEEKYWKEVQKIDSSAQVQKGSKGRIGCVGNNWLVIGSTHQKNYRRVLYKLASLTYVKEIQETFFE